MNDDNKRQGLRVELPLSLELQLTVMGKNIKIKDISISGVCFYTFKIDSKQKFNKEDIIEFVLKIKDNPPLFLNGKIVWIFQDDKFQYFGAKFINMSLQTDSILSSLINDIQRLELKKRSK